MLARAMPWIALLMAVGCGSAHHGVAGASPSAFVHFEVSDREQCFGALHTAVARFENSDGVRVDLVATLHFGEADYYRQLDARLAGYDRVLFELIGTPQDGMTDASELHRGFAERLEMALQVEAIDYSRPNFVHADLTLEEFTEITGGEPPHEFSMRSQREELEDLILPSYLPDARTDKSEEPEPEPAFDVTPSRWPVSPLFLNGDPIAATRTQFFLCSGRLAELHGTFRNPAPEWYELMVRRRNAVALVRLTEALGEGCGEIAILYGAYHMRDFAAALRQQGFHRVGTDWIETWRVDGTRFPNLERAQGEAPTREVPEWDVASADPKTLYVLSANKWHIGGHTVHDAKALGELLRRLRDEGRLGEELSIGPRPGVAYGDVATTVDIVSAAGFEQLRFSK